MTSAVPRITPALLEFLRVHRDTPVDDLLLRIPPPAGVAKAFVAQQVQARRALRRKLPTWTAVDEVLYPSRLSQEQASSEHTARYKADVARAWWSIAGHAEAAGDGVGVFADITAGCGVDAIALACHAGFAQGTACERDADLAALLRHNISLLAQGAASGRQDAGARDGSAMPARLVVVHGDGTDWLARQPDDALDLLYVDPARRNDRGGRVAAFADCTPDVPAHLPALLRKARRVLVKASPMLDIDLACRQLGCVTQVHVVASEGECKELLFLLEREPQVAPTLIAAEGREGAPWQRFAFTREEEQAAAVSFAPPSRFVFEPGPAVMKAGAFRLVAARFALAKLHPNTHLYTADAPCTGFPGRTFRVEDVAPCNASGARRLFPDRMAMVIARNVGVPADALRARLALRDGGDRYAIAATLADGARVLLRASRHMERERPEA